MTADVIRCPTCGGNDNSPPDLHGQRVCAYCGSRYKVDAQARVVALPREDMAAPILAIVVGIMVLFFIVGAAALVGAGYWFWLSEGRSEPAIPVAAPVAVPEFAVPSEAVAVPLPPTADGPASATFEFHATASGFETSYYVLGFVVNESPFTIDKPQVVVVLLDEAGNEVGSDVGFAEDDRLEPGERSPIKILISDPPPHTSRSFEVKARKADYVMEEVAGLRVEAGTPKSGSIGSSFEVEGKVHHDGTVPARFVQIEVRAFDGDSKLVGLHSTYADDDVLEPGKSSRFRALGMHFDVQPAKFEFTVSARPVD